MMQNSGSSNNNNSSSGNSSGAKAGVVFFPMKRVDAAESILYNVCVCVLAGWLSLCAMQWSGDF